MLQIENEYETPIESNYYQKNHNNFQNADNIQEIIDYTEQELKRSSSTNNIYQNKSFFQLTIFQRQNKQPPFFSNF